VVKGSHHDKGLARNWGGMTIKFAEKGLDQRAREDGPKKRVRGGGKTGGHGEGKRRSKPREAIGVGDALVEPCGGEKNGTFWDRKGWETTEVLVGSDI